MVDVIRVEDQFYILATSSLADDRTRVLKHGETFALFDRYGDIQPVGLGEQGLYHEGTRFLSRLELRQGSYRPLLLSSAVREDNTLLTVDLTNPDVSVDGEVILPRDTIHLLRSAFLWQGACYEQLHVSNYSLKPVEVSFTLHFEADFADIFEVRGVKRHRRGRMLAPVVEEGAVLLAYEGLDGVVRRTGLDFSPQPAELSPTTARFTLRLDPKTTSILHLTVSCEVAESRFQAESHQNAFAKAVGALKRARGSYCEVDTSNREFNRWLSRSAADLHMVTTETPHGLYPYAGVPWFSTAFGRDGIIAALETLWVNPAIAKGVLTYLAATQAQEIIPAQDAEPGKILHEARRGELAATGEIPFGQYYGTVDATPLFVILAGAYYERTGDRATIEGIWPNIELALQWIDVYGDLDGDGFVEYARRTPKGLVHQGWKDSNDSVFHADGSLADGPIALCEVQSYVYAAKRSAAELAATLGPTDRAEPLRQQARALQEQFERAFWSEELSTYALALDGRKRPCHVRTSNAGHSLFAGIASQERALRTVQTLFEEDSFSGWGIRTVAASEARFNPMSYHNGSIWPHDNAIIALGLARYGFKDLTLAILSGLFDASRAVDLCRLPELFCGFTRHSNESPTLYPVACAPQAWAAGTVYMLLQACLGLSINASKSQVSFFYPVLPEFLPSIQLRNLAVGKASVDLLLERRGPDVGITVTRRDGQAEIVVVK